MASSADSLGGRLPLLPPGGLTADQHKLYTTLQDKMVAWADKSGFQADTADGRLIGPFNPMLRSPLISQAVIALTGAEGKHSSLSERVRQVVILSVGAVWQGAYELYAHTAVAHRAGLAEPTIQALVAGQTPGSLTAEEHLAHLFTKQLTTEHQIDDELYQRALATFDERGLVDIIYLAGNYMTVCGLLNTFKVPAPSAG